MTVYHGTAANYLPLFLKEGFRLRRQPHLKKAAFCTSKSRTEAERFAIRNTPSTNLSAVGIVLEIDASACQTKDFTEAKDSKTMWDEQEVAFFKTKELKLAAVWNFDGLRFQRSPMEKKLHE